MNKIFYPFPKNIPAEVIPYTCRPFIAHTIFTVLQLTIAVFFVTLSIQVHRRVCLNLSQRQTFVKRDHSPVTAFKLSCFVKLNCFVTATKSRTGGLKSDKSALTAQNRGSITDSLVSLWSASQIRTTPPFTYWLPKRHRGSVSQRLPTVPTPPRWSLECDFFFDIKDFSLSGHG